MTSPSWHRLPGMSEFAERYRKITEQFTERVREVPDGAWDNPAPPDGWVARDVVRHLVEWIPGFLEANADLHLPPLTSSVDEDPVAAWEGFSRWLQAVLDDPQAARREVDTPMGRFSVERAVDMIATNDVFLHTWDLARATGLDERLDPDEVHRLFEGMAPMDEVLRGSGHYGPRIEVPDDADEQTKLIAFIGRRP